MSEAGYFLLLFQCRQSVRRERVGRVTSHERSHKLGCHDVTRVTRGATGDQPSPQSLPGARCLYITSNNQDPDNSFRQLKRVKLDNLLNVKMTQDLDSGVLSGGCFVDFQKSFDGIIEVRKPPDPYNMHFPADIYCHNNFC